MRKIVVPQRPFASGKPTPFASSEVEKPVRERRTLGLRYGATHEQGFSTSLETNGEGGEA